MDAKDVATEGEGGFGEKVEESQRRRVKEEEEGGLADEKLEESNLGEDSRLPAVSKDGLGDFNQIQSFRKLGCAAPN